jgi:hypothetical protein
MDLLAQSEVVGVKLFDLRISSGELKAIADVLRYCLDTLTDEQMIEVCVGPDEKSRLTAEDLQDYPGFVRVTYHEIMNLLRLYCREESLPERFRRWNPVDLD